MDPLFLQLLPLSRKSFLHFPVPFPISASIQSLTCSSKLPLHLLDQLSNSIDRCNDLANLYLWSEAQLVGDSRILFYHVRAVLRTDSAVNSSFNVTCSKVNTASTPFGHTPKTLPPISQHSSQPVGVLLPFPTPSHPQINHPVKKWDGFSSV